MEHVKQELLFLQGLIYGNLHKERLKKTFQLQKYILVILEDRAQEQ